MTKTNDGARVAILMGSKSDMEEMQRASKMLEDLGIGHEVVVTSAHRSPDQTAEYARKRTRTGIRVFIVGAGRAAHLAGAVAANTTLPVLGVPLESGALKGMDALLSTVQMPAGVPVGTLAIGGSGAEKPPFSPRRSSRSPTSGSRRLSVARASARWRPTCPGS
jgi:phosphoribosylaminoimidazole carboxylase PurE protein